MATTKLYLDNRRLKDDGTAPIKITISHNRKATHLPTGICVRPEHWDNRSLQVVGITTKHQLNRQIASIKHEVDSIIMDIKRINTMTVQAIRKHIEDTMSGTMEVGNLIAPRFANYANNLSKRTQEIYSSTYRKLLAFDRNFESLTFDDINKDWLRRFDAFMIKDTPSVNARNIHMRNIRAVFNDAIDNEITTNYPFRTFSIRNTTTRKRSYTIDEIRKVLASDLPGRHGKYMDLFKLSFYLIGINIIDMLHLNNIYKGRVEYNRSKTKRPYSIKIEPEAMSIIEKYRGDNYLLKYMDSNKNYRTVYKHLYLALTESVDMLNTIDDGVTIPKLTTYWARHTWATIASELNIPIEVIAAALGHEYGNRTTNIYINFDIKKVDEANRKVLDYVLYDKK